jgi:hypothetical protein
MTTQFKPHFVRNGTRRRIRHLGTAPGGIHFFACYSLTRAGRETIHTQEIDAETLHVRCSCEDFRFRRAMGEPTLFSAGGLCKHLTRCADWLARHGLMPDEGIARRCIHCGMPDAAHRLCDDYGQPAGGRICDDCARILRMCGHGEYSGGDDLSEESPGYEPEIVPPYEPEAVPDYEPEAVPAGGEDFDVRR